MKKKLFIKLIISIAILILAFSMVKAFGYTETVYSPNYPQESSNEEFMPIMVAIAMELFISIHMTVFVIIPISSILAGENYKTLAIVLSLIRAGILLYWDFFVSTKIALIDFFAVFIGAFIVVPMSAIAKGVAETTNANGHLGMKYENQNKKKYEELKKEEAQYEKYNKYNNTERYDKYDMDEDEEAFEEDDDDSPIKNL